MTSRNEGAGLAGVRNQGLTRVVEVARQGR
jgi:hypothetical protein